MTTRMEQDVWSFVENAPAYADDVADLWHWSTNYPAGSGPITLFLDLIGWSEDEMGEPLSNLREQSFGHVEITKLAAALKQYAERPQDVRDWVDQLMQHDVA